MKLEIRPILMLCTALTLTTACQQTLPPTEDPEPSVVEFRASSQATWVKSETNTTPQTQLFPYDNFGVWGIARQDGNANYILWDEDDFSRVSQKEDNSATYVPDEVAYWFSNHTYNFIAIAPFDTFEGDNISVAIGSGTTQDAISFNYAMAGNHEVLAAGVVTPVSVGASRPSSQPLTFWHLFTKLKINVNFSNLGNNEDNTPITGSVSKISLHNVNSHGTYTISFDENNQLSVVCLENDNTEDKTLQFSNGETKYILPQIITDVELYLDFTIGRVEYKDFKVNITANANNPSEYKYNESYTWNISIGPKAAISFKVAVAQWNESQVGGDGNDIDIV